MQPKETSTGPTVPPTTVASGSTVPLTKAAPGSTVQSKTDAPGHKTTPQTVFKQNTTIIVKKDRLCAHRRIVESHSDESSDEDEPDDTESKNNTADAQAKAVEHERAQLDLSFFGSK